MVRYYHDQPAVWLKVETSRWRREKSASNTDQAAGQRHDAGARFNFSAFCDFTNDGTSRC